MILQLRERHRPDEECTTVLIGRTQSDVEELEPRRDHGAESESMSEAAFCRRATFF